MLLGEKYYFMYSSGFPFVDVIDVLHPKTIFMFIKCNFWVHLEYVFFNKLKFFWHTIKCKNVLIWKKELPYIRHLMFLVSAFLSTQYILSTMWCPRGPCVNRHSHSSQEWGLTLDYRCLLVGLWACNHIECMKNEIKSKPYFCTVMKLILRTDHLLAVQCVNLPLPWICWCSIFASVGPDFFVQ